MKKNTSRKSVLAFPYKSFTAACGKAIDLWETGPSTVKSFSAYYEALWEKHKEEIIEGARHVKDKGKMDVGYFALLPIKVIARLDSRSEYLQNYVRFFLRQSDEKPKDPLVDMYVVDDFERILLEDISCLKGTFWFMADGKLKTCEGCYDNAETFIDELDFAFQQYMGQYELMGDDAVWNLTFKLKKTWRDLIWALLDIVFSRVEDDASFDAIFRDLRAAFQELPFALYKLECRRYQELFKETGTSIYRPFKKKDLNGDGFNPSDRKILHQIHRASVFGETPTDAQTVGDLRRQQVAYGASLYRPSSRHVKGVSFADAAQKAILAQQFKGVAGAYTMSEKHSLARAIQRACKKKLSCDKP